MPQPFDKLRSLARIFGTGGDAQTQEKSPGNEEQMSSVAERIYQDVLRTIVTLVREDVNNTLFYFEDAQVLSMLLKEEQASKDSVIRHNPIGLQSPHYTKSMIPPIYERSRDRSLENLRKLSEKPEHDELFKVSSAMSKLAGIGFRYTIMRFERQKAELLPLEWIISATIPEGEHTGLELQFFFVQTTSTTITTQEFVDFVKKSPRAIKGVRKHQTLNQFHMTVNGKNSIFNWLRAIEIAGKNYQVFFASTKEQKFKPKQEPSGERNGSRNSTLGLIPKPRTT